MTEYEKSAGFIHNMAVAAGISGAAFGPAIMSVPKTMSHNAERAMSITHGATKNIDAIAAVKRYGGTPVTSASDIKAMDVSNTVKTSLGANRAVMGSAAYMPGRNGQHYVITDSIGDSAVVGHELGHMIAGKKRPEHLAMKAWKDLPAREAEANANAPFRSHDFKSKTDALRQTYIDQDRFGKNMKNTYGAEAGIAGLAGLGYAASRLARRMKK